MERTSIDHRIRESVGIDPVLKVGDPGVDPRDFGCAADAPRDQPHHRPAARLRLTHQRRAPVPRARVLTRLTPRADLARVQRELVPHAALLRVNGGPKVGVAAAALHQRDVHLVLQELEGAVGGILAPAGDPAPRAAPVVEPEVELVIAGGQADGVDGGGGEVDGLVDGENGEVVVEAGEVEAGMLDELDDGVLLVGHALGRIEAAGVVLAHSHLQQAKNKRTF
jgi:hypothetical protein